MSVLQTGMFRTKLPPWVNRKFRTGRHSSQLFKKLDVKIDSSNIEDCHWLPGKGPKRVDVKFSKRKNANRLRKVKKNVKDMDLPSICIRSLVYINDSLCKYCKMLWRKWKKLSVNKFIHSFWVSNGSIRLKLSDNGRLDMITHIHDLEELFPGNEFRDEEQVVYFQLCFIFKLVRWV